MALVILRATSGRTAELTLDHGPEQRLEREFLESLRSRRVDYVIVGAQSLAFHTRLRYTGAVDILIRPTPKNARRLFDLVNQFGFAQFGLKQDFADLAALEG